MRFSVVIFVFVLDFQNKSVHLSVNYLEILRNEEIGRNLHVNTLLKP